MHYQLAFKDKLDGCPIWFDFAIDALYISDTLAAKYFFEKFTIRPGQANEPQWQLGEMRTRLGYVVFADEKVYAHAGALLQNLEALERAFFPEITQTSMSLITKNKQTVKQFWYFINGQFLYFTNSAPYEHSRFCKLRLRFVTRSSLEILRQLVT
jgi:hypothetical protein